MNDFAIILRSLRARAFSTAVTAGMVAVAVALLLVLLSMSEAGRRAFERGTGNMHMLVSRDASPLVSVLNGVFYANAPRRPLEWSTYERIANARPWAYAIPVQQGDSYRGHPVLATTSAFFTDFKPEQDGEWEFVEGSAGTGAGADADADTDADTDADPASDAVPDPDVHPSPVTEPSSARDEVTDPLFHVILGAEVAAQTGLRLGDHIELTHGAGLGPAEGGDHLGPAEGGAHHGHVHDDFSYTVTGILAPTGGPHDRALIIDLRSSWIIHAHDRRVHAGEHVHSTTLDDLTDADRLITGIYLRVPTRPGASLSGAQQQAFDELRRDPSITVADPAREIDRLFTIVGSIDDVFVAMAAVVMFSSGIAIMLALYNSMEQRRRQIAILRVLGASRGRVFGLVMTEAAVIALIGAVAGALLALAGAAAVAAGMKARLGLVIEPQITPEAVAAVLIGTILLAAAAALIPSIMAYRTPVAEKLRPAA